MSTGEHSGERIPLRRAGGGPVNVLVVEDEPMLTETLSVALRFEGWEVLTADDGRTAVTRARVTRPDVVVLDVMLPDRTGYGATTSAAARTWSSCMYPNLRKKIDSGREPMIHTLRGAGYVLRPPN